MNRNKGPKIGGMGLDTGQNHKRFGNNDNRSVSRNRTEYDNDEYENDIEEAGNHEYVNDEDYISDDSGSHQHQQDNNNSHAIRNDTSLPLYQRLAKSQNGTGDIDTEHEHTARRKQLKLKRNRESDNNDGEPRGKIGRTNKNAPAVMMSNRPVRRLRVEANNSVKKTIDPRFSDFSGKADDRIFARNYSFLDSYRDDEIKQLATVARKVKSAPKKAEIKSELIKMKQEATERRRGLKVLERFEAMRAEEREKVRAGKKPFFLKSSARKAVELEERFSELKREGKLSKFMTKKRKKNSNKDHRWLPERRTDNSGSGGGGGDY